MNNSKAFVISLYKDHIIYVRALIASLKHYHPEIPILILKDGSFKFYCDYEKFNVSVIDSMSINKLHGFKLFQLLNKINILFLPEYGYEYDYYIHFDADSILTNKIDFTDKEILKDFVILQGGIKPFDDSTSSVISKYAFNPNDFEEFFLNLTEFYFFSSGHFVLNKSTFSFLKDFLSRYRFDMNMDFSHSKKLKFGDQGFFNLAINVLKTAKKITVGIVDYAIYAKQKQENFPNLSLKHIETKLDTGVLFIHFTGPSRRNRLLKHNYGDLLYYFSKKYFEDNHLKFIYFNYKRLVNRFYKMVYKRSSHKIIKFFYN